MAEWAALEMRYTSNGIEGSNPSPTALRRSTEGSAPKAHPPPAENPSLSAPFVKLTKPLETSLGLV